MQQVNLYVQELRPKKEWITAKILAFSALGLFVFLVGASLLSSYQLDAYKKEVKLIEQKVESKQKHLVKIKNKHPGKASTSLDEQLVLLRDRMNQRIKIKEMIGYQSLGNQEGYSARMIQLAEKIPDDLSLSRIHFSRGAHLVNILGVSKTASSIPLLISQLQSSEQYADAEFGPLTIAEKNNQSFYPFSYGFDPLFKYENPLVGVSE